MAWTLIIFFLAGATTPDAIAPPTLFALDNFATKDLCNAAITTLKTNMSQPMPPGTARPISFMGCLQKQ